MKKKLIVLFALVFGAVLAIGCGAGSTSDPTSPPQSGAPGVTSDPLSDKEQDIKLTGERTDATGTVWVTYTIHNGNKTVAESYAATLHMVDAEGTRVGEAFIFESDVPPGGTVKGETLFLATTVPDEYKVVIGKVS